MSRHGFDLSTLSEMALGLKLRVPPRDEYSTLTIIHYWRRGGREEEGGGRRGEEGGGGRRGENASGSG